MREENWRIRISAVLASKTTNSLCVEGVVHGLEFQGATVELKDIRSSVSIDG